MEIVWRVALGAGNGGGPLDLVDQGLRLTSADRKPLPKGEPMRENINKPRSQAKLECLDQADMPTALLVLAVVRQAEDPMRLWIAEFASHNLEGSLRDSLLREIPLRKRAGFGSGEFRRDELLIRHQPPQRLQYFPTKTFPIGIRSKLDPVARVFKDSAGHVWHGVRDGTGARPGLPA